jgi:hypothetical protein
MFEARFKVVRLLALGAALALPASAYAEVPKSPTFTKDIAPIFQEKCEACHRPDSIAPMSLKTYSEVRPWVRSIKSRVEARNMPPWQIDRSVGVQKFKNDRSLSDDQYATVMKWIEAGAPQGDAKDMPAAKVWPDDQGHIIAKLFQARELDQVRRFSRIEILRDPRLLFAFGATLIELVARALKNVEPVSELLEFLRELVVDRKRIRREKKVFLGEETLFRERGTDRGEVDHLK